ncbi:MAG TPA: phage tail tape measure protein, partial [Acidimicrobiia bacterium]
MALNLGPLNVLLRLQGASRFRRETESVSSSMLKTGAAITAGALAARKIAQEIVEATKVFAEFERSMVRVGAVTNSLGTQAFAGLTERAQELAQTTEFTGRQVANAMGFMGMAGMSTNKIFESTPAVLQLASAGMVDVATAADTVTNIMAGYGIEAKDLGKANDVLVATFTNSNTSLQQLGQSFKYVGPVAKSAGVEFREAAAVIGLMGNAGIQADMAGTALRGTIIKLLDPTKEGAEIMRQYGINATDSAGKLRPMVEIFRQLEPIADDSAKMIELFGLRAGPGMQAALSQGTAALERLIGKIDAAGGIAERIAEAQLDTLDGKIKILGSNFEALQIAIGEAFAPAVTGGVEALSGYLADATTAVKELVAATDDASGSIAEFGTAANTAMRNYLRAIGATLGLNMDAVELTYEKTEAESKLAAALEREEQIRARLAYLGQEATFQTKQFGVASNVVTSEIQQLTEELEAAHGVVLRMGRDMRKVTAGGFPVARVNPNLGQDPMFQPRRPPTTTRAARTGPAFDAMAAAQDLFKGLPTFIGTTEMSFDEFNELLDNG